MSKAKAKAKKPVRCKCIDEADSHTPGPWHLETVKTQVGSCHKIGPFPSGSGFVGKQNHACVYSDGNGVGDKSPVAIELAANARLIAAAPDLLAACQAALAVLPGLEVRSWPPGHAMKKDAIEKLKAAIEKATPTAHSPPGESR